MNFENNKFESGVAKTMSTMDKLKAALKFDGATKGLDDIEKKSRGISFGHIGDSASAVSGKMTAMATAAGVALGGIALKAASVGANMVKSLTIGPISGGLKEYETNLNSVQTILANTQASGAKLKDVNKALQELNLYSDKTIYNFSEMAKNIGTFTAAGVDLKTATASIKGIANLAAVSGSNSQQASTAMYQLSQAISSGRVSLQDWNSVVNAGMGGTVFQRALAQTAEKMGTLSEGSVELKGKMKNVSIEGQSFRESITAKPGEQSWLTSKVLTETLKQFTGDLSDADLAAQGFSKSQIKAIQDQAKMAVNAATQVKTLSGVLDTARESAESGWATTWQIIFGDFGEAKTLFTNVSNAVNGFIGASASARNKVLGDWKALGGRTELINGIKAAFDALASVVTPIKEAFREIFPATTGKQLYDLTVRFKDFMETLKIGPETSENLKRTFSGLFALLDIGKQIIFGVFTIFTSLLGALGKGSGGFLEFTGSLGDGLVALDQWLKKGDRLHNFFRALGGILATPIQLLMRLKDILVGLFDGIDASDADRLLNSFDGLGNKLKPLNPILDAAKDAWGRFISTLQRAKDVAQPAIDSIVHAFSNFADVLAEAFKSQNFDTVFEVLQTGLLAGIAVTIKKFLGGGLNIDFGGKALDSLSEAFDSLTGSLKTMQTNVKANTVLQIAAAMAVLAVSVVALSKINADDLSRSMTAIAVGFGQLIGAMAIITKVGGSAGFAKIPVISGSLILLATAIDVLAIAVTALSKLSWDELARGLGGVGALLIGVSLAVKPLSSGSAKLILVGGGLIAIGIALRILAESVEAFGKMDWKTMGKGLAGVAGSLVAVGLAVSLVPPSVLLIGPGLIAVSVALGAIAGAVAVFGHMNVKTLAKGLGSVAIALLAIAGGIALMPPTMALQAAGLVLVGLALTGIAAAVGLMGGMSIGKLAKGIIAIGAALVVLAGGLTLMIASLPGAVALGVAAAALTLLVPVIGMLGNMSWGTIGKGLLAIGAAMLVIGTVGLVAAPALAALGVALVALGAGLLLVGTGIKLMAAGLSVLGSDGTKGVAVLIAAITGIVAIMPKVAIDFAKGLVAIVKAIADVAPQVVNALAKILATLLTAVIQNAPKMAEAFTALIQAGIKVLRDNVPAILKMGWDLLRALLRGMSDHIGEVTNQALDIVTKFLNTVAGRISTVVRAGFDVLVALMKGINDNMRRVVDAAGDIMATLLSTIGSQFGKVVAAGADAVVRFIRGIDDKTNSIISAGAGLIIDTIKGVSNNASKIATAGREAAIDFLNALGNETVKATREGADAVIRFVNGVADAIRDKAPAMRAAGANLASAIIGGLLGGLDGSSIVNRMVSIAGGALNAAKRKLGIKSPSREFMEVGQMMIAGWVIGVEDDADTLNNSVAVVADDMVTTLVDAVSQVPHILDGLMDMDPTITPVLDLTSVRDEAARLGEFLIDPLTSTVQAASISSAREAAQTATDSSSPSGNTEVTFVQNNNSPKALSEAEIYRQTKNQLSLVKAPLRLAT
jgi:tape measure domain-containing protein